MRFSSLRAYLAAACLSSVSLAAYAQQLPVMNHYIYNPYLYNPARTGQNDYGSVFLNFKNQWVAVPDAPITGALSAEAPIKGKNIGLGGMLYLDKTHIINRIGGLATAAYHIPFSKDPNFRHALSGGISLGAINQRFDFPAATVANPNDQAILSTASVGTAFDFSLGLDYQWKNLHVGASMLQGLNNPLRYVASVSNGEVQYINTRHWMFSASYLFKAGKDFEIQPILLSRAIKAIPFQIEANVLSNWRRFFYLGLGYRSSNIRTATAALTTSVGMNVQDRIFFGYSFEFAIDGKINASLGTQHEITVAYRFGQNKESDAVKAAMDAMKQREEALDKRMQAQDEQIKALNESTQRLEKDAAAQRAAQDSLRNGLNQINGKVDAQQKQLDDHQKAIDSLRTQVKTRPLEYKKMGEVYFGNGKTALDAESKAQLDAFASDFAKNPKVKVYLYGHASADGDENTNFILSNKRCAEVRKYLIAKGISGDRIRALPSGEANIVNPNSNQALAKDRRVELIVSESE